MDTLETGTIVPVLSARWQVVCKPPKQAEEWKKLKVVRWFYVIVGRKITHKQIKKRLMHRSVGLHQLY